MFCLFLGAALLATPRKHAVIDVLDVLLDSLMRVNSYVVRLTPIGVFAITASAAGTMTIEEFGRIQGYLISYTLMVGVLTFLVLPAVIQSFTPFSYREILGVYRTAGLTAFATGKVVIVLPMLVEETERLFEKRCAADSRSKASVDVLYPLAYPFPHLGKLAGLLFIPFAAWFVGRPLDIVDYPMLMGLGLVSFFAGPLVAVPFLLDVADLPADMMHLFVVSGIWAGRVGDVLGVMYLMAFTLITASAITGIARWQVGRAIRGLVVSLVALTVAIGGTHAYLSRSFVGSYQKQDVLAAMNSIERPAPFRVLDATDANPAPLSPGESRLDRIRRSKTIRVGFRPDRRPFSFLNERGALVGFDVEMAHEFAHDNGIEVHFVPVEIPEIGAALENDHVDVVMTGLLATLGRALESEISTPYLEVHPAVVTHQDSAHRFESVDAIRSSEDLVLAVSDDTLLAWLGRVTPASELRFLSSEQTFFESSPSIADGLITSAEAASAWTLAYPDFRVVVPRGARKAFPLAYPLPRDDRAYQHFFDHWLDLKQRDGTVDTLYEHWVLGKTQGDPEPRWCILRDVLGWIE